MELLDVGAWRDLRPGMNVLCVADIEARTELVDAFKALTSISTTDQPESVRARIAGTEFTLDADLQLALHSSLGSLSAIMNAGNCAASESAHPSEVSVRSAVELLDALSLPDGRPDPAGTAAKLRHRALITSSMAQVTGSLEGLEQQLLQAKTDLIALQQWSTGLFEGFRRIDDSSAAVAEAEEASSKKLAGPSAFNRYLDAKQARESIVRSVGFENYEVYRAEAVHVMDDADERITEQQTLVTLLGQNLESQRSTASVPIQAEIEILAMHIDFDERLSKTTNSSLRDGTDSPRYRNFLRRGLRTPLSQLLLSMDIEPGEDPGETAQHWLASLGGSRVGPTVRVGVELAIETRLEALAGVPSFGPVPLLLDDPLAGLSAEDAQATFGVLIEASQRGHQLLYVCSSVEAERISPLARLFVRAPAIR